MDVLEDKRRIMGEEDMTVKSHNPTHGYTPVTNSLLLAQVLSGHSKESPFSAHNNKHNMEVDNHYEHKTQVQSFFPFFFFPKNPSLRV